MVKSHVVAKSSAREVYGYLGNIHSSADCSHTGKMSEGLSGKHEVVRTTDIHLNNEYE